MADYTLEGPRWGTGAPGTGGGTVTWAVDGTIPAAFVGIVQAAFATWSSYADITFQQVASTATSAIDVTLQPIDGPSNVLGQAAWTYAGQRFIAATVTFDSGEGWHASGGRVVSGTDANLALVALHEIGHAIGLGHSDARPEVMNAVLNPSVTGLAAGDIAGIQALYGARPGGADVTAVYRFYDTRTGDHFYTTSTAEKAQIQATLPWYAFEGAQWATPADGAGTLDVFRFFDTATQAHFYTTSVVERDQVLGTMPSYRYEGVAFEAYADAGTAGALTLERFYNTQTGQHHFAASAEEAAGIGRGAAGAGWVHEGQGFTVHVATDGMLFA